MALRFIEQIGENPHEGSAIMFRILNSSIRVLDPAMMDYIISLAGSRLPESKCQGFRLIEVILNLKNIQYDVGRLIIFIDKLPNIVEYISHQEVESLEFMFASILSSSSEQLLSRFENILPRLVTSCLKLVEKSETSVPGIRLLLVTIRLLRTPSLMSVHTSIIRKSCSSLLIQPTACLEVAQLLALCNSIETTEMWFAIWQAHCIEIRNLIMSLGISTITQIEKSQSIEASSYFLEHSRMKTGSLKAIYIERAVKGCVLLLNEMLLCGCITGPVIVDYSLILPIISSVLSTSIEYSRNDTKFIIESEKGVSPADIALVITELKLVSIRFLKTVLRAPSPALLKVSAPVCATVTSLVNSAELRSNAAVLSESVQLIGLASLCFPTVMAVASEKSALNFVIDLFLEEISLATQSNVQTATNSTDITESHSQSLSRADISSQILMQNMERIFLGCGALLEESQRLAIEVGIGRGLGCIAKGTVTSLPQDRRLRRYPCEKLRSDTTLQASLLRLGTIEVQTPHRNGGLSGNLSLLRRAAQNCLFQEDTVLDAKKALCAIEIIIHPCAVVLPPVSVAVSVEERLLQRKRFNERIIGLVDADSSEMKRARESAPIGTTRNVINGALGEVPATDGVAENHLASSSPQDLISVQIHEYNTNKQTKPADSFLPPTFADSFIDKPSTSASGSKKPNIVEDEDLPDIDIDADPDDV